ncbi:MAG TPA: thioredoxin family protein [Cytophagaceae bacterium]|nr:thioredoxin family protein [Cytophagaceae bacterium]
MKINFLWPAIFLFSFIGVTPPYKIGDKINNFTLYNAADDTRISLNDFVASRGVVLVFTSNDCPYAKLYEKRLLEIQNEYNAKEIKFLFINPNNPQTSPADNKTVMKKKAYPFPYLIDSSQEVANIFEASKTPEVFVLKNINGSFMLKYKGAIDDNPQAESDVSRFYLKDALNAIVSNGSIKVNDFRAIGCMIQR